jgi:predicted outer membrane repeat protein
MPKSGPTPYAGFIARISGGNRMSMGTNDRLRRGHLRRRPGAVLGVVRLLIASLLVALATFTVAVLPARVAGATTDTVTNCSGSASTVDSLPYWAQNASSDDFIDFDLSPACSLITLSSTITIATDLIIEGPGPSALAISGNHSIDIFNVESGVTVTISGLTIEDGLGGTVADVTYGGGINNNGRLTVVDSILSGNSGPVGGGIESQGGTLTIADSTFSDNTATTAGGAIANYGTGTISDTTVSDNSSSDNGGGIHNGGTLTLTDSTVAGNSASGYGGGISDDSGTMTISNSTVANNSASAGSGIYNIFGTVNVDQSTVSGNVGGGLFNPQGTLNTVATIVANSTAGSDCSGDITDDAYNLDDDGSCGFLTANHSMSDVNPDLGPLQNNGGPTETQSPATGSPVLDQIPVGTTVNSVTLCPGTDQRGVERPQGPECDMGAVELVSPQAKAITSVNSATATVGSLFSFTVTTAGSPTPSLTEKGKLPKHLSFASSGSGTASIAGIPNKAGVYYFSIRAKFGTGTTQYTVIQAFTLTVGSGVT